MSWGELSCYWLYRDTPCLPSYESCNRKCPTYKEAPIISYGGNPSNPIPNYDNGDCAKED